MVKKRIEYDSLGEVEVPETAYYGAQTKRSSHHFNIGQHPMPLQVVHALALIKKASAEVNCEEGLLSKEKRDLIVEAAEKIASGSLSGHFPLSIWQTGSGTHTNMNVNEVIANLASEKTGAKLGTRDPLHPIDDVNMSQSSNDVFPTAMSVSAADAVINHLLPHVQELHDALLEKQTAFADSVKVGRTHLMDATPISFGQEFSGYVAQISQSSERIKQSLPHLCELACGGTAVGTGLNTPKGFAEKVSKKLAKLTNLPLTAAPNRFAAQAAHDAFVASHGALKTLAVSLLKIATDLSWMVSGPMCGLSELTFPANEPGSSIMAGKVNPTQCEALTMVCTQVLGNDTTISIAGSRGNFELNVLKPVIIHNFLESCSILGDACHHFTHFFVQGLAINERQAARNMDRSLMLVTALIPKIGYDNAAKVALKAFKDRLSLKEAAVNLGYITEGEFDAAVDPKKMI